MYFYATIYQPYHLVSYTDINPIPLYFVKWVLACGSCNEKSKVPNSVLFPVCLPSITPGSMTNYMKLDGMLQYLTLEHFSELGSMTFVILCIPMQFVFTNAGAFPGIKK